MRITYDTEAKALYIFITAGGGLIATEETEDGILLDRTKDGIAGIELLNVDNVTLEVVKNDESRPT